MVNTVETLEIQVKTTGVESLEKIAKIVKEINKNTSSAKFSSPVSEAQKTILKTGSEVELLNQKLEILKAKLNDAISSGNLEKANSYRLQMLKTQKAIDKVGDSAKKSSLKISKFIESLKRIALYRIIRTVVKEISEALQEGLNNAYAYSKTVNGELAQSLDALASASAKMKNQLGAAFGTLLQGLTPILIRLANLITTVANAITRLFAILGGKTTYLKAKDITANWADDTERGASAAKEWKNQLMAFDEINRLDDQSGSGGGSGSGTDYGSMFEEVPTNASFEFENILNYIRLKWEDFKNNMKFELEEIVSFAKDMLDLLFPSFDKASEKAEELWGKVKSLFPKPSLKPVIISLEELSAKFEEAKLNISAQLEISKGNILIWATESANAITKGAKNMADNLRTAFQNIGQNIYTGLQNAYYNIATFVNGASSAIGRLASSMINSAAEAASGFVSNFISGLVSAWNAIKNFASALGKNISGWWSANGATVRTVAQVASAVAVVTGIALAPATGGASLALAAFADGGFPTEGQLFIANEAGAEMVGSMNGRTAVANNDQIVEGIQQGVYNAMMSALSEQGQRESIVKVFLDSREIRTSQRNLTRAMGV